MNLKPIGIIAIILVSVIALGCVETTIDDLPQPKVLSQNDKKDYAIVDIRDLIKSSDSYLNKNIMYMVKFHGLLKKMVHQI